MEDSTILHVPPHEDRRAILTLPRNAIIASSRWHPFGAIDLGLWVGPNLAVARQSARGRWHVTSPDEAHALLLEHALHVPAALDDAIHEAAAAAPLGTPIDDATATYRAALPGFTVVSVPSTSTTLFLRPDAPVFRLTAGKYRDLEDGRWVRGDEGLALMAAHPQLLQATTSLDTLIVSLEPTERRVLARSVVLAVVGLIGGPLIAAPLLLIDAMLWLIGAATVWVLAVAAGPALLTRWSGVVRRRTLRLDPWRLWLPRELGPAVVERSSLVVQLTRRAAFGAATTGFNGRAPSVRNSAMTYLSIRSDEVDVTIGCEGPPPAEHDIPLVAPGWNASAFAQVAPADFRRLVAVLAGHDR